MSDCPLCGHVTPCGRTHRPPPLDVDLLVEAMDNLYEQRWGVRLPPATTTIGGEYADQIAAEYERLAARIELHEGTKTEKPLYNAADVFTYAAVIPTCGVCTDLRNPHGECPEHGA